MQDVGKACLASISPDTLPFRLRILIGKVKTLRICVPDVIGLNHAITVNLDTVQYLVPIRSPAGRGNARIYMAGRRSRDPVGLDQMDPERIRAHVSGLHPVDQSKNVTTHEPARQSHLLHLVEVIDADIIAVLLPHGPQVELAFDLMLPCVGLFVGHLQHIAVDPALQLKPHAYDVGPVRVDRTGCDRRCHVKHPASLSQRVIVFIDIINGRPRMSMEPSERSLTVRSTGFRVSAVPDPSAGRCRPFKVFIQECFPPSCSNRKTHCGAKDSGPLCINVRNPSGNLTEIPKY